MLGFLPTRAYRPGTPGATIFLSPLSGTFNYGWDSFAYRRKWGSERKHLPDVDVSCGGGWKDTVSLKRAYQQADADTILSVVHSGGELREKQA